MYGNLNLTLFFQLAPARLTLKLRACTLRSTVLCIVLRARIIIYTTRSVVYIVRRESYISNVFDASQTELIFASPPPNKYIGVRRAPTTLPTEPCPPRFQPRLCSCFQVWWGQRGGSPLPYPCVLVHLLPSRSGAEDGAGGPLSPLLVKARATRTSQKLRLQRLRFLDRRGEGAPRFGRASIPSRKGRLSPPLRRRHPPPPPADRCPSGRSG
jgi:hypothetical protein